MGSESKTSKQYEIEITKLREQLEEAENTLQAVRNGRVDAFVMSTSGTAQVRALSDTDYLYRLFVESMNEGAVTLVPDGTIFYCNQRFAEIMRIPTEKLVGTSFFELTSFKQEDVDEIRTALREKNSFRLESVLHSDDGGNVPVEISAHALETEDIQGFCIVVTDITERKQAHENLRYIGSHDTLTGLLNRNTFEESLARLEKERQYPISVIAIDINGLKQINDQFGHAAGDDLIKRVAVILKEVFRADDILARIGGDEFAILLPNVNRGIPNRLVNRIKRSLRKNNALQQGVKLEFSLGVATTEEKGSLIEVLKQADNQMYKNKRDLKGNRLQP
jgi:diguanylate cyclase (GGDEF)-like protein/PAS domain S-box-containing protein